MSTPNFLDEIIKIFKDGNESSTFIDTVQYLHNLVLTKNPNADKFINALLGVHNKLRNKYKLDFNGEILYEYRRFIGLYKEKE